LTEPIPSSTALLSVPTIVGRELEYLAEVLASTTWGGDGKFSRLCAETIQSALQVPHALLTHSCTAALEMAAILARLQPGDEVIMPSFTFVSTANAVVLRGAIPVFVDIRPDTQNIDEMLIEAAVTERTRAIIVVHYAGICCEMDKINRLAARHGLLVIEDAAHAYLAAYHGRLAGSLGDMAAISFHETKNVISGEGGAFITKRTDLAADAEVIRDKGTERSRFLRGEIKKYSWVDIGSSYLPSELIAAVLYAQLECAQDITMRRLMLWNNYHAGFAEIEAAGSARRPIVPPECRHNGHIYYLLLDSAERRDGLIKTLRNGGIAASFHYVPLHNSVAGLRFGRSVGDLRVTSDHASRLVRLPLHGGVTSVDLERVVDSVNAAI
jgi:dTDP-4-amino-4,6-dideoxygalactose transaminase